MTSLNSFVRQKRWWIILCSSALFALFGGSYLAGGVGSPTPVTTPSASASPAPAASPASRAGSVAINPPQPKDQLANGTSPSPPTPSWLTLIATVGSLLTTWAFVALVTLFTLKRQLAAVLRALVAALQDRAIAIQVAGVNLQFSQRAFEVPLDQPSLFSRSPFEIDPETPVENANVLTDFAPQIQFSITDYVAQFWVRMTDQARNIAVQMRAAREQLKTACDGNSPQPALIREKLKEFAATLEASRFLEAQRLLDLVTDYDALRSEVVNLSSIAANTVDRRELKALHCLGVAHAQRDEWANAIAILDKILFRNEKMSYLPAADTWLACKYNQYIKEEIINKKIDVDTKPFFDQVKLLVKEGTQAYQLMETTGLGSFTSSIDNVGFYKRELLKTLALMNSILGEHSADKVEKAKLFGDAENYFKQCTIEKDHDPPTALDYNNLADIYIKMGKYTNALEEMHKAFAVSPRNAMFCSTSAGMYWKKGKERDLGSALFQLGRCTETDARLGGPQEMQQYVENQILAAKFVKRVPDLEKSYLPFSISILERARQFVEVEKEALGGVRSGELEVRLYELLGYAHLQIPNNAQHAVDMFERALKTEGSDASDETKWKRRVPFARALIRLAGYKRHEVNHGEAAELRSRAEEQLINSEKELSKFDVNLKSDAVKSISRRSRFVRIHLDTLIANLELAEECFYQQINRSTKAVLERVDSIENGIIQSFSSFDLCWQEALGEEKGKFEQQLQYYRDRFNFLLGQVSLADDPTFANEDTIPTAEKLLISARGRNVSLDCRIELVLGQMLLSAALNGKGDTIARYDQAIAWFQSAAGRSAPGLRSDSLRMLSDAHAKRNSFRQEAKNS